MVVVAASVVVVRHYHLLQRGRTTALSVDDVRRRYEQLATTAPSNVTGPSTVTGRSMATSSSAATSTTEVAVSTTDVARTSTTAASSVLAGPPIHALLPRPGVYVYATTGGDRVDALGGDHHNYPATTTLTVMASDCGVQERWDVARQRWEEWHRCVDGDAVRTTALTTYDEFFGQGQTDAYACTGDARPLSAQAGATWTVNCVEGIATDVHHGVVLGNEPMLVGSVIVSTEHVQITIENGQRTDSQVTDSWFLVGTDFLVAQKGTNRTTNPSPVGAVTYHEDYELHLTALEPLT